MTEVAGRRRRLLVAQGVVLALCGCGRLGFDLRPVPGPGDSAPDARRGDPVPEAGSGGRGGSGPTRDASVDGAAGSGGRRSVLPDASLPALDAARDVATDAVIAVPPDARPDGAPRCAPLASVPADPCLALPPLGLPPLLDGVTDCSLPARSIPPLAWTGALPSDTTAAFTAAWRPDGLYFRIDVTDPLIVAPAPGAAMWQGDGVEIYVDSDGVFQSPPLYDQPGTRQFIVAAPSFAGEPPRTEVYVDTVRQSPPQWQTAQLFVALRAGGYVVEAVVTPADLGVPGTTWSAGGRIGFDLAVNVSYPDAVTTSGSGHRLGQFFFRGDMGDGGVLPFGNVSAFCSPLLGGP